MKMKNDFVLVREVSTEKTTPSGILLPPEKWKRKAVVVKTCEGSPLQEGDLVLRNVGRGTTIQVGDEELEAIHQDWIMAIL
jgi:co-chaperonin GroES (HSP10)